MYNSFLRRCFFYLWAAADTEESSERASTGSASEPSWHTEDFSNIKGEKAKTLIKYIISSGTSCTLKKQRHFKEPKDVLPLKETEQVERDALPQILWRPCRMPGSFYSALPAEPHSCRTHGCMWSTSLDRALSSEKCLLSGSYHPWQKRGQNY